MLGPMSAYRRGRLRPCSVTPIAARAFCTSPAGDRMARRTEGVPVKEAAKLPKSGIISRERPAHDRSCWFRSAV